MKDSKIRDPVVGRGRRFEDQKEGRFRGDTGVLSGACRGMIKSYVTLQTENTINKDSETKVVRFLGHSHLPPGQHVERNVLVRFSESLAQGQGE